MRWLLSALAALFLILVPRVSTQTPAPPANPQSTNLGTDANGNPIRRALKTGHVSNYDEAKVPPYTLPDPLVLANGQRVRDASLWKRRREEIIRVYEHDIFGRVPANAPKVTWQVTETNPTAREGTANMKRFVGRIGDTPDGPRMVQPVEWKIYLAFLEKYFKTPVH